MKYDLAYKFLDIKGNAVKDEEGADTTLGTVLCVALLNVTERDKKLPAYKLLTKLVNKQEAELSAEEVAMLVEAVKMFPMYICGLATAVLNQEV